VSSQPSVREATLTTVEAAMLIENLGEELLSGGLEGGCGRIA
jgi:hypothetical protein